MFEGVRLRVERIERWWTELRRRLDRLRDRVDEHDLALANMRAAVIGGGSNQQFYAVGGPPAAEIAAGTDSSGTITPGGPQNITIKKWDPTNKNLPPTNQVVNAYNPQTTESVPTTATVTHLMRMQGDDYLVIGWECPA